MNRFEQKLLESPSLPRPSAQARLLLELLAAGEPEAVVEVLEQDPDLAARVHVVLHGKEPDPGELETLHLPGDTARPTGDTARPTVDGTTLCSTALCICLAGDLRTALGQTQMLDAVWRNALMTGLAARALAIEASSWNPGEALLAGVVEKFGALLFFDQLPEYPRLAARYLAGEGDLTELERDCFDFDHGSFAIRVLERWRLPKSVLDALRAHFALDRTRMREPSMTRGRILTSASLYGRALALEGCSAEVLSLERRVAELNRIPTPLAARIATELPWQLKSFAPLLSIPCEDQRSYEDLVVDARELLIDISSAPSHTAGRVPERARNSSADFEDLLREGETSLAIDPRTGRFDLAGFERMLNALFDRARQVNRPLSLLVIGVDDLRGIVERLGQRVADDLLEIVSDRVAALVRRSDPKGHLSDSYMGVIAAGCSDADVPALAERIRAALTHEPLPTRSGPVQCEVSIGMASIQPVGCADPQTLLNSAWGALDEAALAGGPIAVGA